MPELELLTAVCRTMVNCHFNLSLISKKLVLNNVIVGKKYGSLFSEGKIKKKKTIKKNKKKHTIRRDDFLNQVTFVVHLENHHYKDDGSDLSNSIKYKTNMKDENNMLNMLNIKMFRNGKIMTTGGLSKEDAEYAIMNIFDNIKNISDTYNINPLLKVEDLFYDVKTYIHLINTNYLSLYHIFAHYDVCLEIKLDYILYVAQDLKSFNGTWYDFLCLLNQEELYLYSKILQIFLMCLNYLDNIEIRNALVTNNSNTKYLLYILDNLYQEKDIIVKPTFDEDIDTCYKITDIVNFNSKFRFGSNIDRDKLLNIINENYKDRVVSCHLDKDNYPAVIIKLITNIKQDALKFDIDIEDLKHIGDEDNCEGEGESKGEDKDVVVIDEVDKSIKVVKTKKNNKKCDTNESIVSIFAFQTGMININGSRIWGKNIEGFKFINEVLEKYRDEIVIQNKRPQIVNNNPQIIEKNNEVFINPVDFILKSPRNTNVLKSNNLYNLYKIRYLNFINH